MLYRRFYVSLLLCRVLCYTVDCFGSWGCSFVYSSSIDVYLGDVTGLMEYTSVPYSRNEEPSTDKSFVVTAMVSSGNVLMQTAVEQGRFLD